MSIQRVEIRKVSNGWTIRTVDEMEVEPPPLSGDYPWTDRKVDTIVAKSFDETIAAIRARQWTGSVRRGR